MISAIWRLSAAAGLIFGLTGGALAGPIADQASTVEKLLASGDGAGALKAFDAAEDAFWTASPLQFRVAVFADAVKSFADYQPRANSAFHAGETVTIYLEPVGYGFASDGDLYRVSFNSGVEIHKGDVILGKTDDLGALGWQGREKSHEVHVAITLTLPNLKPADYQLLLTLNDQTSGKSATTTLPFSIVE